MATNQGGASRGRENGNDAGVESVDVGAEVADSMQPLIPWLVSVFLHAGILLLACFFVWTAAIKNEEIEPVVPYIQLSKNPSTRIRELSRPAITNQHHDTDNSFSTAESSGGGAPGAKSRDVSFGPGVKGDRSGKGVGENGDGPGVINVRNGHGPGGSNPFDSGTSGRSKLHASLMKSNSSGNVRSVVYLIDGSGSLIDTLPFVLFELTRSINALSEEQKFTVIFFQGSEPHEVIAGGPGLKHATATNKKLVTSWIDPDAGNVVPAGLSNPLKAMRLALSYKPDLIFLLSDNITGQGRYEVDQRQLLRELAGSNRSLTKINTIQYLRPDPLTRAGMPGTMELIADHSGGTYVYMGAREMNIE